METHPGCMWTVTQDISDEGAHFLDGDLISPSPPPHCSSSRPARLGPLWTLSPVVPTAWKPVPLPLHLLPLSSGPSPCITFRCQQWLSFQPFPPGVLETPWEFKLVHLLILLGPSRQDSMSPMKSWLGLSTIQAGSQCLKAWHTAGAQETSSKHRN